MTIGDWDIKVTKEEEFKVVGQKPQKVITYNFTYLPLSYSISRTIQYIKFHTEEAVTSLLTSQAALLKTAFIDPMLSELVKIESVQEKRQHVSQ